MTERSNRAEVRNPVLALPSARLIADLNPESRATLAALLLDLAKDAGERAQKCWRTHEAPMVVYWKAVGVDAKHLGRAIRPRPAIPGRVVDLDLVSDLDAALHHAGLRVMKSRNTPANLGKSDLLVLAQLIVDLRRPT